MVIYYNAGPLQLNVICKIHGSVFPKAFAIAMLPTILAVGVSFLISDTVESPYPFQLVILENSAVYSSFSFVIGFLLVFRTQTAYSRFWEGTTLVQVLRGVWVGAFGSIVAFTTTSKNSEEEVLEFRLKLARLMSCLHANALDFIAGEGNRVQKCLGIAGLDKETLSLMNVCEDETLMYVLVQWIQQMILYNMGKGVISTPPPIVSRVFQDLSTGIVTLNNAKKISETPFPLPYAQALSTVIIMHAAMTPFVFAVWTHTPFWAGLFTFTAVFLFSTINFIAAEIEQPFGDDANDIDLEELQNKFNNILVTMLSPQCTQRPMLQKKPGELGQELRELVETAETSVDACGRVFGEGAMKQLEENRKARMGTTVSSLACLMSINHNAAEHVGDGQSQAEQARDLRISAIGGAGVSYSAEDEAPAHPLIATLPVAFSYNAVLEAHPISVGGPPPSLMAPCTLGSAANASGTEHLRAACDSLRTVCRAEAPTDANVDGVFLDVKCQTVSIGPPPRTARVKDAPRF